MGNQAKGYALFVLLKIKNSSLRKTTPESPSSLMGEGGHLITYNSKFEWKFLAFRGITIEKNIDVMLLYESVLKIPHEYYGWKYPKLDEAIQIIYKSLYNKVLYREKHNALVDTYLTYKLFRWYPYITNPKLKEFGEEN